MPSVLPLPCKFLIACVSFLGVSNNFCNFNRRKGVETKEFKDWSKEMKVLLMGLYRLECVTQRSFHLDFD
jgi:hypothetical protein